MEEKQKALDATVLQIQKKYGKGAIMKIGDAEIVQCQVVSTGSMLLDNALGVGGLPRGRLIEIYGPESSGKTTLALHTVAEMQKLGGKCAFVDAEHAIDPVYAQKIGVDIDECYISQPDSGEQALEITEMLVRSGSIDLIVVDSVAALTPQQEIDGEMGDASVGLQARLLSKAMRKLTPLVSKYNCIIIFINQLREKIGVMFGNPETTTGGRALKFYSSVRLDIRRIDSIKSGGEVVANKVRVKVVKNKVAPPFKEAEFEIVFGEGIDSLGEILDLATENNIIVKSGAWFSYEDKFKRSGKDNTKQFLKENPELFEEIKQKVLKTIRPEVTETTENVE